MNITLTVEVEVERVQGKFAARDEIVEALLSELEMANPGSISGVGADGMSEYEVVSFEVEEEVPGPPVAAPAQPRTSREARPDGSATCTECSVEKPLSKFPTVKRGGTLPGGRHAVCRSCKAK